MCVGTISDNKKEENTRNSILAYVGNHLYVTHQINPSEILRNGENNPKQEWEGVTGFTSLPEFFEKTKNTVHAWREVDTELHNKHISTNGLVGFLEKTTDEKVWTDMYNCVHATVTGGESFSGGFRFNGKAGSSAKWPVRSQGQNQLYKFTENAFTITAKITIHTTSKDRDISVIGASASPDGMSVFIGLGYKREGNKWYVMHKTGENINTEVSVELDKEYKVAITFANGRGTVYVDGVNIANKKIPITGTVAIDHFFLGGTGIPSPQANGHSCTVKNVMLFSRALQQSEIKQFGKIKNDNALENPAGNINSLLSKNADGTKGSSVHVSAVACICFVCSLITMVIF